MKRFLAIGLVLVVALFMAANMHVDASSASSAATGRRVAQQTAITGTPSLSASFIDQVLGAAHSPMAGAGALFVRLSLQYSIDNAYTLAIFHHESGYGTTGEAHASKSPGNLRCLDQAHYGDLHTWCRDRFAWFPTWSSGLEAMYRLLAGPLYAGAGLVTIDQVIARWAPDSDGNNSAAYVAAVLSDVQTWRSEV